ncbi:MAG: phage portal protein, partial [Gemmatimonadota bacterium]
RATTIEAMPRSNAEAVELGHELLKQREQESRRLDLIHDYLRDDPDDRKNPVLGGLPKDAPQDVLRLARISRVNLLKFIVNARVQAMFVDGFQTPTSADNVAQWTAWQRNRMDARQIGVHRAALAYGASYVLVLPGDTAPVMRGYSPRKLTVGYGDDDDWPAAALEKRRGKGRWRLIDNEATWELVQRDGDRLEVLTEPPMKVHEAQDDGEPVCPVVRYRDTDDLDDPVVGIVEPFIPLQDQINVTTFGLMVAQHYGAFRQRYIIGWLAETEKAALKMGASRVQTFEDPDVKVGEFAQTDLRGYIESREANLRHLATVSQTAVHELLGQFVNLSAAALEAARASHHAAVGENRIVMGEAHEQALNLAGSMLDRPVTPEPEATVAWRDTRVRSLSEAATAFGQLVRELGVPPRELWHRIPGIAQHEVERWIAAAEEADESDPIARLEAELRRQTDGAGAE